MPNPVQRLLYILALATDRELARQLQFAKAENQILRSQLPNRITISRSDRSKLLKYGVPLGSAIKELITIVVPETFARWVREANGKPRRIRPGGRSKKPPVLQKLILKIARETGWGYTRVLGEIRKLTRCKISRQTVANIMREHGLEPGPKRGEKTWDEFIRMHGATLWQCDFFTKKSWTFKGLRDLYVLAFLNVGTRRVYVTPSTAHPNRQWLTQQATAFGDYVRREKLPAKLVFHDADPKLGKTFDGDLRRCGLTPQRLRPRSPNMNAFVERWIQSIQLECLDHFIVFGEAHLDYLVTQFVEHFHIERPHQGLDNKLVRPQKPPDECIPSPQQIVCKERLGGLLKHYERRAA